jgi:DNA-binding MarR family transcriptional regulator
MTRSKAPNLRILKSDDYEQEGSKPPHVRELHAVFQKWLYLPPAAGGTDIIDVVAATYLANQLRGARLWLCLIGPSATAKTTIAESLLRLPEVYSLDRIGQAALASGYVAKGAKSQQVFGFLDRLDDNKSHLILIPDFSNILNDRLNRDIVLSQLRRIYDGKWSQHHGSGKVVDWKGKVGLIACATPNFERIVTSEAIFGERFVYWKTRLPDPRALGERALRNVEETDGISRALQIAMMSIRKLRPKQNSKIPLDVRNALSDEVAFVAKARTPIERHRVTREILDRPYEESPARLAQQLGQLQVPEPSDEMIEIVESCAYSSIPNNRLWAMAAMGPKESPLSEIQRRSKLPRSVLTRVLEELTALELVKVTTSGRETSKRFYAPTKDFRRFFHRARRVVLRAGYESGGEGP